LPPDLRRSLEHRQPLPAHGGRRVPPHRLGVSGVVQPRVRSIGHRDQNGRRSPRRGSNSEQAEEEQPRGGPHWATAFAPVVPPRKASASEGVLTQEVETLPSAFLRPSTTCWRPVPSEARFSRSPLGRVTVSTCTCERSVASRTAAITSGETLAFFVADSGAGGPPPPHPPTMQHPLH